MIDDEEIMEDDECDPELKAIIEDALGIINTVINEIGTSEQSLDVLLWFGLHANLSVFNKDTKIRQSTRATRYDSEYNIRYIMEKMTRDFPDDERHYGYWGWLMTLKDLQELQDLMKKHIQAPFV